MDADAKRLRLRHKGPLQLGPGVVWREGRGWRYACPLGCATPPGEVFATASEAGAAARAHWESERDRELAEIAQGRLRPR
ncbi:MAG: hypothetical protein JOZ56_08415 [Actinobacteria bacterium]|nr:hypothetical protein [Actinomycetota bacterium]MBV8563099.1 hypothetical protein [Actinomycetota bacterium]